MLEKSFDPLSAEPRLYEAWEKSGAFQPNGTGAPFTIVIPPPNVTGSLHMGHALNNTLQDVLCRFERMRGRSVLWQPGTDHAGIATQMVVEREMAKRQEPRRTEIGRDKFLEKVWAWKAESGGTIIAQLKRLGASCDWSRERFTMDEGLSVAVRKVFVQLYREGLLYRDKRLVNWDPKLVTAISDLEVENTEVAGHFWHFKYPLENGETYQFPVAHDDDGNPTEWETRDYISIATTRPETMLGDGAVAVHPSDKRYAPIVGKRCLLPLADRYIPIIADDYPDPDFGSGAVKITGAHDFNDYKVAMRNNIPLYILMDERARMLDADYVPEKYRGLDRFDARKQIVEDIDARGLLIKVEDKKIMQPFGDRSNVVIEPMLTDQWYVDAETLAMRAIEAVEKGETRFVPETWAKTYFQWMRNIEPWCVSRQLWWGHRIPAWYGTSNDPAAPQDPTRSVPRPIFVAEDVEDARCLAATHYGLEIDRVSVDDGRDFSINAVQSTIEGGLVSVSIFQDPDVLDTWFSSALWPFSTLGWPEEASPLPLAGEGRVRGRDASNALNGDSPSPPAPLSQAGEGRSGDSLLAAHYPTTVLVTAHDIIFFWVARMMMMGTHFMDDVPFKDVYIHALVLDEKGQKMSKSKGNVIDPLTLIDKYGADALRFTLAAMAAQGRNIRLSEARVEGYRNFGTKLWNAARFCEMNGCAFDPSFDPKTAKESLNQWIIHEAGLACAETTAALESYRFNDAAGAVYKFAWNVFCDWHLELTKPILLGPDSDAKAETQKATAFVLTQILKLLHPFMPFVTEEIWCETAPRASHLIVADWPKADDFPQADKAATEINWMIGLITAIRSARSEMNVPAGAKIPMAPVAPSADVSLRIDRHRDFIARLARLDPIATTPAAPKGAVQIVYEGGAYALPLAGVIDIAAERARLAKEIGNCAREIETIDKKMSNPNFVDKAPIEIVEENRERRVAFVERQQKLLAALTQISDA